jgi:hypothetical protein
MAASRSQRKRNSASAVAFALAAMIGSTSALAGDSVNTGYFGGVAIMGYDTVAYFTEGKAVKGSEEFTYDWLGTPWHFASKKHQDMFMNEPDKFAPQYGGYCAPEVAITGTATINIDPEAFKIIDGKLYLVYDPDSANFFKDNAKELVPKANDNWPNVQARLEADPYH